MSNLEQKIKETGADPRDIAIALGCSLNRVRKAISSGIRPHRGGTCVDKTRAQAEPFATLLGCEWKSLVDMPHGLDTLDDIDDDVDTRWMALLKVVTCPRMMKVATTHGWDDVARR
jgi:hypothetical protein